MTSYVVKEATWRVARAAGQRTYVSERPCKNLGHPRVRYTSGSQCVECLRQSNIRNHNNPGYREKRRAWKKRWAVANPEKATAQRRRSRLKRQYGLTVETWNALFAGQGKACAICGSNTAKRKSGAWSTDHDHTTGAIRGILCLTCNTALGNMQDDPARLRAAASYLESVKLHESTVSR